MTLVVLTVGVSALAANASADPDGLVGHWAFDDGTGKDLSGNGNDALLAGGTIYPLGQGQACVRFMPEAKPLRIPASEDSVLAWLQVGA